MLKTPFKAALFLYISRDQHFGYWLLLSSTRCGVLHDTLQLSGLYPGVLRLKGCFARLSVGADRTMTLH